jgi:hypothetical protein
MQVEPVVRIADVVIVHESVTNDFRDDRGGTDQVTDGIASNDGPLRKIESGKRDRVDQQRVGDDAQAGHGLFHGSDRRLKDIVPFDLADAHDANTHRDRHAQDLVVQALAFNGRHRLGIPHASNRVKPRKDDGGGDHRARERPAADFIDTGDPRKAVRAEVSFMGQHRHRMTEATRSARIG